MALPLLTHRHRLAMMAVNLTVALVGLLGLWLGLRNPASPIPLLLGLCAAVASVIYLVVWERNVFIGRISGPTVGGSDDRWWFRHRHLLGLTLLVAISVPLLFFRLGAADIHDDEFQVVDAATGYHLTGEYYIWDWLEGTSGKNTSCALHQSCHYSRAWPHTWLVAKSFDVFGISEWSSRLPSAVFGVLFIPLVYLLALRFTGRRDVALLTALAATWNPGFIILFRYTRMYALLIPLFLLLWYTTFRAMTTPGRYWFRPHLILATVGLLVAGYEIHLLSLIILPIAWLFAVYLALWRPASRFRACVAIGIVGIAGATIAAVTGVLPWLSGFTSFFSRTNIGYIPLIFSWPFPPAINVYIVLLGGALVVKAVGVGRDRLVYLYLTLLGSTVFYVWIADRYVAGTYVAHLLIFCILAVSWVTCLLTDRIGDRRIRRIVYVVFVVSVLGGYLSKTSWLYDPGTFSSFSRAYRDIDAGFRPSSDVLFGQYLRPYYLPTLAGMHARTIDMLANQRYQFRTFIDDLNTAGSGWITWETKKASHLQPQIVQYVATHFEKHHGAGIDDTDVEVYRFDRSMLAAPQAQ